MTDAQMFWLSLAFAVIVILIGMDLWVRFIRWAVGL